MVIFHLFLVLTSTNQRNSTLNRRTLLLKCWCPMLILLLRLAVLVSAVVFIAVSCSMDRGGDSGMLNGIWVLQHKDTKDPFVVKLKTQGSRFHLVTFRRRAASASSLPVEEIRGEMRVSRNSLSLKFTELTINDGLGHSIVVDSDDTLFRKLLGIRAVPSDFYFEVTGKQLRLADVRSRGVLVFRRTDPLNRLFP